MPAAAGGGPMRRSVRVRLSRSRPSRRWRPAPTAEPELPIEAEGGFVARWRVRSRDALGLFPNREAAVAHIRTDGGLPERLPHPVEVEDSAPVAVPDACLLFCDRAGCDGARYAIAADSAIIGLLCVVCGHVLPETEA